MVAYSFQKEFEAPIRSGVKAQTIRPDRKRHARPGETIQLYTGQRTRHARLIGTAICRSVGAIEIDFRFKEVRFNYLSSRVLMGPAGVDSFAVSDGFANWIAMQAFWRQKHGDALPVFSGVLVVWHQLELQPTLQPEPPCARFPRRKCPGACQYVLPAGACWRTYPVPEVEG
jgi:hypothetical protein